MNEKWQPSAETYRPFDGSVAWTPLGPPPPPAPKRRRPLWVLGGIGGAAISAGAIGAKFLLGTVAVGALSGTISAIFVGPLDRLPADVRAGYEQRLQAAVGMRLDGMSDEQKSRAAQKWVTDGILRLDDARVVRRLELQTMALGMTDTATCAQYGRASFGAQQFSSSTAERMISALDTAHLTEWMGIMVEAVEAEARGAPARVTVTEASANGVIQAMIRRLPQSTQTLVGNAVNGLFPSDTQVCDAIRTIYATTIGLPERSRVIVARYDIQGPD